MLMLEIREIIHGAATVKLFITMQVLDIEEELQMLILVLIGLKRRLRFKEFWETLETIVQQKILAELTLFRLLKETLVLVITLEEHTEHQIQETSKTNWMQLNLRRALSNLPSKNLRS